MNITKLYEQFKQGTVSKDHFIKEARRNFSQWISPVTSFNDAVTILKGKRFINEAHQLTVYQMIDRVNPHLFKIGMEIELAKQPIFNNEVLEKTKAKVAKKLFNDPKAYSTIDPKVSKYDANMQMTFVKKDNFVDENNGMKKVKGFNDEKSNTKDSTKENKKGMPKGVKEFTQTPKKHKKVKAMETPGKPKTLKENFEHMDDHNNTQAKFPVGMKIKAPIENKIVIGVVHGVINDTISLKLDDGTIVDIQSNVVKPREETYSNSIIDDNNPDQSNYESIQEKKDRIIKRLKNFLKNKKLKKEDVVKLPLVPGEKQKYAITNNEKQTNKIKQEFPGSSVDPTLKGVTVK
jgi:hypothetical protein